MQLLHFLQRVIHGQQHFLQLPLLCRLHHFFNGDTVLNGKAAVPGAQQKAHMGRCRKSFAYIMAQGTDVCTAAAIHIQHKCIFRHLFSQSQAGNFRFSFFGFHHLTLPGQRIQGLAPDFNGRIGRRPLQNGAAKPRQNILHFFPGGHFFTGFHQYPLGVLSIRFPGKGNLGRIAFAFIGEIIQYPCGPADHDGQHPCRFRVQRAGMAHSLPRQPFHHRHRHTGRHTRGFEQIDIAVHLFSSSWLHISFSSAAHISSSFI